MADAQIVAGGTSAAPLIYTVPGAQEIILKSLFAVFDGSAAATAWYPTIRVKAPGGKVVGEYITDTSVAAGGSAEVSFGPFLRSRATTPVAASTSLLYGALGGITVTSNLYLFDSFTGTPTSVGAIGFALTGLCQHPGTNVVYGLTNGNSAAHPRSLITVNLTTGAGTFVAGPFGVCQLPAPGHAGETLALTDLAISAGGVAYACAGNDFGIYTLDLATAATTLVGNLGVGSAVQGGGLDFDPAGVLWLIPGDGSISTVNTTTGAATFVHNIVSGNGQFKAFPAAKFDPEGVLWGLQFVAGAATDLMLVGTGLDPGTSVRVASTTLNSFDALAWAAS